MPESRRRPPKKRKRSRKRVTALELDDLFDRAANSSFRNQAPERLYHYTKWEGGEGIVRTQKIWATAHDCTNDEAELRSADETILAVANELVPKSRGVGRRALELFVRDYSANHIAGRTSIYIASFSEVRDDENQWSRYGEQRCGLCFAVPVLAENPPVDPGLATAMVRVVYGESQWKDRLREDLGFIARELSRPEVENDSSTVDLGVSVLNRRAAFESIAAKETAWSVEREVRQVALARTGKVVVPKHRPRGVEDIRYVELMLRRPPALIALAEIIIGPACDDPNAEARVVEMLAAAGYVPGTAEYPVVCRSALPLGSADGQT